MAYSPYFVGPYATGLQKNIDSYLIPEDAFPNLENAYVWRGRVYKKGGYNRLGEGGNETYRGRLGLRSFSLAARTAGADVYNLTLTANALDLPILPGTLQISDGTTMFIDNGTGGFTVLPAPGNGTVNAPTNYATSAINITFNIGNNLAPVTATFLVQVSANSPVMGLATFDINNSIQPSLVAFDLKSAYQFNSTSFLFDQTRFYKSETTPQAQTTTNLVNWHGNDTDFFDTCNYQGAMFATNNNAGANFYSITNITNAAAAQVTTSVANNFAVGDVVYFNNVTGMTQINGLTGRVTIIGNPFTVNINSAAFGAYTGPSGIAWAPTLTTANTGNGDGIRWFDGFTAGNTPVTGWVNFNPPLDNTAIPQILLGCLLILPYKGYLVVLNTVEGTSLGASQRFTNRARWSTANSTVYYGPPLPVGQANFDVNAWNEDLDFRGDFLDAPTSEDIVAAEFIKDTLVVYFERSTWKLTYTGNAADPFIWEKINTEIGATSTFSTVPFDKNILSVGPNGAYACDSINIDRVDRIIPDEVFQFLTQNNNNKRIYGVRDFFGESVQWTFLDNEQTATSKYPTKTLYYNYLNNSFSIFRNCFTCFGHFNTSIELTWGAATNDFNYYDRSWNSFASQSGFPIAVAGNQQGFVFQLQNANGGLFAANDISLQIQNITNANPSVLTIINHNLQPGDTVLFAAPGTAFSGRVFQVGSASSGSYTQNTLTLVDIFDDPVQISDWTYGGFLTIIDNFTITSKNLNPFYAEGSSVRIGYYDIFLENLEGGSVQLRLYINDDSENVVEQHNVSLQDQFNDDSEKFWTRVFFNSQANFIGITITLSQLDLFITEISQTSFVLHGSIFWMKPTGRLLYR